MMITIYQGIITAFSTLAFIGLMLYYMHMFQLNSYAADEQLRWMKHNYNSLLGRSMGVILSIPILLLFGEHWYGAVPAAILLWMTFSGNRPRKGMAKKDFAVTKRVKRLMITICIIYAIFFTWQILDIINGTGRDFFFPTFCCLLMTPFVMIAANFINRPMEKRINRKFIDEAKSIVAGMPALTVIGITGSYGKTSMKHFVTKLLAADRNVYMTPGNFNTELGVTIAVRRDLKPLHEVFVCEMGARRVGEIKAVCDIAKPTYGILTSIGPQHLETFGSMENIIHTKFELADALPQDGTLFVNYDDPILREEAPKTGRKIISYGLTCEDAMYRPQNLCCTVRGSEFDMTFPDGETVHFTAQVIGTHNVLNLAGALAVADAFGVPKQHMVAQVRRVESVAHRLQMKQTGRGILIDDAYNSNPVGAKAALDTLAMFDGMKILITPGMVELGEKQEELNRNFGRQAAEKADVIILIGKRQTEPIYAGVCDTDFPKDKLFVAGDLQEGLRIADGIKTDAQKIILLENDLPDNY